MFALFSSIFITYLVFVVNAPLVIPSPCANNIIGVIILILLKIAVLNTFMHEILVPETTMTNLF